MIISFKVLQSHTAQKRNFNSPEAVKFINIQCVGMFKNLDRF